MRHRLAGLGVFARDKRQKHKNVNVLPGLRSLDRAGIQAGRCVGGGMKKFVVLAAAAFVAAPAFAAELGVLKPLPGPEPYYGEIWAPPAI